MNLNENKNEPLNAEDYALYLQAKLVALSETHRFVNFRKSIDILESIDEKKINSIIYLILIRNYINNEALKNRFIKLEMVDVVNFIELFIESL